MARVLVTGASGFIGRNALPALVASGFEVHALSRTPRPASEGVAWHAADLGDHVHLEALMREVAPTHLLHLAWETSHGSYYTTPRNETWLRDSLAIGEAFLAAGGRRIVGAGSSAEYDLYTGGPLKEDATPLRPNGLYGTCKVALHEGLEARAAEAGAEVAWGRVFFCYGPEEHPTRAIPRLLLEVIQGKRVPFQAGLGVRDYLHVRDVAGAFATLVDSSFRGPVNIGSGQGVTLRELVSRFAAAAGRPDAVDFGALPTPAYEPAFVVADATWARERLGWRPSIDLETGIQETVAWWLR